MDIDHIINLIEDFYEKHPMAANYGSEYVMQNDEAQIDALNLICKILDSLVP